PLARSSTPAVTPGIGCSAKPDAFDPCVPIPGSNGSAANQVGISTVAQLYAAVNDPANADTLIVLAPGVYTLSSIAPNGGTLLLQPHMALAGYNEYQDVDGDGVWDEVYWPAEGGFPVTPAFARPKTETIIELTSPLVVEFSGGPAVCC